MIPHITNYNIAPLTPLDYQAAELFVDEVIKSKGLGILVENAAMRVRDQKQTWQDAFDKKVGIACDIIYVKISIKRDDLTILDFSNLQGLEKDLNKIKRCASKVDKSFNSTMDLINSILEKNNSLLQKLAVSQGSEVECKEASGDVELKNRKQAKREPVYFTFDQFNFLASSQKEKNWFAVYSKDIE